jgi:hypothetical protein
MGTKNNPGRFDCYSRADPDEPFFVLLGRDPLAPALVRVWARMRQEMGEDPEKVLEAFNCASVMAAWAIKLGKKPLHELVAPERIAADTIAEFTESSLR